jgi:hypothetical protein
MNNYCSNICPGGVRFEVLMVVTMKIAPFLECNAMLSGRNVLTFGRTSSFHYKGRIIKMEAFLLEMYKFLPANMALHPRRQASFFSSSPSITILSLPYHHRHHSLCCH